MEKQDSWTRTFTSGGVNMPVFLMVLTTITTVVNVIGVILQIAAYINSRK